MEIPGAVSPRYCEELIDRFEEEERNGRSVHPGMVGPQGAVDTNVRNSMNLEMTRLPHWNDAMVNLRAILFEHITTYLDEVHLGVTRSMYEGGYDSMYSMMRYDPGSVGYHWHNDFMYDTTTDRGGVRTVTWLIYFSECEGGETEFRWGRKIKPETGKVVFFPSTWCMVHRGCPVISGKKYLGVGWFMSTWNKGLGCVINTRGGRR